MIRKQQSSRHTGAVLSLLSAETARRRQREVPLCLSSLHVLRQLHATTSTVHACMNPTPHVCMRPYHCMHACMYAYHRMHACVSWHACMHVCMQACTRIMACMPCLQESTTHRLCRPCFLWHLLFVDNAVQIVMALHLCLLDFC